MTSQADKQPYAVSRPLAGLTLLSILSPLSGLAMEMALAWRYGASGTIDAFRIAMLLGSLGMALFFGYLLPHVVVPMFAEYRAKGMEQEGWRLAFSLALGLTALSSLLIGWVWLYPEALADLLGPGLAKPGRDEANLLLRCFSLSFLFMAWSGVASGILSAHRVFWPSALSQLLPNVFILLAVIAVGARAGAEALALGILLGYAAMAWLFIHKLLRTGRQARIDLAACLKPASAPVLRKAMYLSLPLLATILIGQWSIVVINRALSTMPPGTLAEFGYAWKLLMLVNLLPAGLATVVFPALSDAHASRNSAELSRLVSRAFRMTLLLTLPLTVLLLVERMPIVSLMFGRGGMTAQALADTSELFAILLIGAPAGPLGAALSKVAYSRHDTRTPAWVALFSALAITLLVPHAAAAAGTAGVVWVFTSVAWAGCLGLLARQIYRDRLISLAEVAHYAGRLSVLSMVAALPVLAVRAAFGAQLSGLALPELILAGMVFAISVYVLSKILRIHEVIDILAYAKWQSRRWLPLAKDHPHI